jgi:thiol:disulfide interchange protein DsbD
MAAAVAGAPLRSGRAGVELLAARDGYQPGTTLWLALRMRIDDGWHGYWVNPGESGMPTAVKWRLPAGWQAGELQFPAPRRFLTGGLPGFGYTGEVVLPVALAVPAEARGRVELRAEVRWLTCADSACVPGEAELMVALEPGGGETPAAAVIAAALDKIPRRLDGAVLEVGLAGDSLRLRLSLPQGVVLDRSALEVFPVTENVLQAGAVIAFTEAGGAWQATVAKSEYATGPPAGLELVLAGGGLARPALVRWVAAVKAD